MSADQEITNEPSRPPMPGYQIGLVVLLCGWSAFCLFYHLGDTPLWNDEADTALFARSIARTGGLNAVLDHNINAFGRGVALRDLRMGIAPPLSYLLAAPWVGKEGTSSLMARLPFALCGLLSVALMLYWMWRDRAEPMLWWVFSAGIAGSAALWLFCRQSRYYSLALLLTLAIAYLYLHWRGRRATLFWMSLLSIALLGTHYLPYAGLYAALAVDYWFFHRHQRRLAGSDWLLLVGPQIVCGAAIVATYNPLGRAFAPGAGDVHPAIERLQLIWWTLRDLNQGEFGVGLALLAAPLLAYLRRDAWLMRAVVALVAYVVVVSLVSPQVVSVTTFADIRYVSALIPLCILITAKVIVLVARDRAGVAFVLSLLAFGTTLLHFPVAPSRWRSSIASFVREVATHRPTAMAAAIDWVTSNVKPGESVWVTPDFLPYPLIYHAPQAVYAWQLAAEPDAQFQSLPSIHFYKRQPVDVILAFGWRAEAQNVLADFEKRGVTYRREKLLRMNWDDRTRPELFWHSFRPVEKFNMGSRAVYALRRNS